VPFLYTFPKAAKVSQPWKNWGLLGRVEKKMVNIVRERPRKEVNDRIEGFCASASLHAE
jgi:hypothetical protein